MTQNEDHHRRLRGELLKLKANSRGIPTQEWIDTAFGIIEREKVRELEAYKERQYLERQASVGFTLLEGDGLVVREDA